MNIKNDPQDVSESELQSFILELAEALLVSGCSSHRLEYRIQKICESLNLYCQLIVYPSAIHMQLENRQTRTLDFYLLSIKSIGLNLGKLHDLSDLAHAVASKTISISQAQMRLDMIQAAKFPYPAWVQALSYFFVSALFFRLLQGNLWDSLAAGVLSLGVFFMEKLSSRGVHSSFLSNFFCACVATTMALGYASINPKVPLSQLILAGLIVLVPGLALTNALAELSHRQLVSGTARLMESLLILIYIAFGVYLPLSLSGVWK